MLAKNDLLVEIAQRLSGIQPNWDEVIRRLKIKNPNFWDEEPSNLVSKLSETYVQEALERICSQFGTRVDTNPVNHPQSTENFYIDFDRYGHAVANKDGYHYSEADALLLVDGLPVLIEVKLRVRKGGGKRIKKLGNGLITHPTSMGLGYAMGEERVQYLIRPWQEYFKVPDCGYVLVIPPGDIKPGSEIQRRFLERNGLLVSLYTDRLGLRLDILRIMVKDRQKKF